MGRNRKMAQASASPAVGKPFNVKIDGALLAAVEAYTRCIGSHGVQRAAPAVGRQGESRPVVEMGTC